MASGNEMTKDKKTNCKNEAKEDQKKKGEDETKPEERPNDVQKTKEEEEFKCKYYWLQKVAIGQFGVVWLAKSKANRTNVAIKSSRDRTLKRKQKREEEQRKGKKEQLSEKELELREKELQLRDKEQQEREIQILKKCKHENIIQFIECYQCAIHIYKCYIVMEHVDGVSLQHICNYNGAVAFDDSANVSSQLLEALIYIHSIDIIHRDIKSDNVLVSRTGQVKLCDFGFAQVLGEKCYDLGTAVFLAPEHVESILNDNHVHYCNKASDIWAFGITVIVMVTGQKPYYVIGDESVSKDEAYARIVKDPPNRTWFGSQPREVDDFINCSATLINERQSAEVLRKHKWLNSASAPELIGKLVQEMLAIREGQNAKA